MFKELFVSLLLVTTSKALVTRSDALVTSSFLLLLVAFCKELFFFGHAYVQSSSDCYFLAQE